MLNDEEITGEELEKLFAFQDKHLTKDKKAAFVKHLLYQLKIPLPAVLAGIRDLQASDLTTLKMGQISQACRARIAVGDDIKSCRECCHGTVVMKDEEGRYYSMACSCGAGYTVASTHQLARWHGHATQTVNGRMLSKQ